MAKVHLNRRMVLGTLTALAMFGYVAKAQADILFHNDIARPVHFGLNCGMGTQAAWTVKANQTTALACGSGMQAASVEIRTDHGAANIVIRAVVHDGREYHLAYDRDGDVNIRPTGD